MAAIMEKTAAATAREPFTSDYRGTLYGGFMLTPEGPKMRGVQRALRRPRDAGRAAPLGRADLVEVMLAVAEGRPEDVAAGVVPIDWAVSVVLASEGYPGAYEKGKVILGIEEAEEHARRDGLPCGHRAATTTASCVTNGGRVLNVVAQGRHASKRPARRAYEACDLINFEGKHVPLTISARRLCRAAAPGIS